jgi:DNA repair protein RadC
MLVRETQIIYRSSETLTEEEAQLNSTIKIFNFLKDKIGCATEERFAVLILDAKMHLVFWHEASIGTVTETIVHPREVFKIAIREMASSIIIAHNHPSGGVEPSDLDLSVTRRLKRAGKIIGIPLLDHVIVTTDKFYSLRANKKL